MKLFTYANNYRAQKVLIAAEYNGVKIETPKFDVAKDSKTKEFLAMNPLGKVPVLETANGCIFESGAIARYVARLRQDTELCGANFFESGLVDQWVDFSTNEIELAAAAWTYPLLGIMPANEAATAKAKEDIKKALGVLDKFLATRTYLVGDRVTLADISVACGLLNVFKLTLDAPFRKPFGNVVRWFTTCVNQAQFKKVLGDVKMCEKAGVAASPKAGNNKKVAASPKKKEEKKEVVADAAPAAEKKDEHWSKSVPESKLIMDDWKKMYSNNDVRKVALPWLWENYDAAAFSIWLCEYKDAKDYCEDKVFKNANLVGGFFQRCERVRKYGFGTINICGEEPPKGHLEMVGAWLFRGQEIIPEMIAVDDCEHYAWRKADLSNAADKQLVEDYFAVDGSMKNGKKLQEAAVFK